MGSIVSFKRSAAMKDSEIAKLRLSPSCNKPLEHEKWIMNLNTTMKGLHPEIGHYWYRVSTLAEKHIKNI